MHTPEGMPLPPDTLAELQRDMARLGFVVGQIKEIDARCCAHNDEAIPEYETVSRLTATQYRGWSRSLTAS